MLKITIEYSTDRIKEMEDFYRDLKLNEQHLENIKQSAEMFQNFFPGISAFTMRGCIVKGLTKWQQETKRTMDDLNKGTVNDRILAIKSMNEYVKEQMKKLLKYKKNEEDIDKIFEDIFKIVTEQYKSHF